MSRNSGRTELSSRRRTLLQNTAPFHRVVGTGTSEGVKAGDYAQLVVGDITVNRLFLAMEDGVTPLTSAGFWASISNQPTNWVSGEIYYAGEVVLDMSGEAYYCLVANVDTSLTTANWVPIGGSSTVTGAQLDFASLATAVSQTVGTGAWTDITATPLSIAPLLGTRNVEIEAQLELGSVAAITALVGIFDDTAAAILPESVVGVSLAAGFFGQFHTKCVVNPGAGTRGYRPQIKNLTTSTTITTYGNNVNNLASYIGCVQR